VSSALSHFLGPYNLGILEKFLSRRLDLFATAHLAYTNSPQHVHCNLQSMVHAALIQLHYKTRSYRSSHSYAESHNHTAPRHRPPVHFLLQHTHYSYRSIHSYSIPIPFPFKHIIIAAASHPTLLQHTHNSYGASTSYSKSECCSVL
jgi:hypothetical protein